MIVVEKTEKKGGLSAQIGRVDLMEKVGKIMRTGFRRKEDLKSLVNGLT